VSNVATCFSSVKQPDDSWLTEPKHVVTFGTALKSVVLDGYSTIYCATLETTSNIFLKNVVHKGAVIYLTAAVYLQHKQSICVELYSLIHQYFYSLDVTPCHLFSIMADMTIAV
jgi:hypothetical protein